MAHQWRSYFTTHYNWDWVVQEAFGGIPDCKYCSRASELPSSTKGRREKYSLFRLDFVERCQDEHLSSGNIIRIRLDSPAMEGLDPKDLLFRHMERTKMSHFAPITQLVLWDTTEMSDIKPLPTNPAILKAPLGSGGFGLYFVYHPRDIMEVVTNHRRRAERYPSFLPNIIKSYGEFPLCWSIQEVIDPIHCRDPEAGDLRRSQVRGYVIFCNGYTFVYNGLEVRLPSWDMDIESLLLEEAQRFGGDSCESGNGPQQLWSDEVEQECCGSSHARPYNESRSKHDTKRYLIDELVELTPFTPQILDCLRQVFGALTPELRARHGIPPSHGEGAASMCVIGVDLLVSEGPRVVVVEVNNNPAMPRADKQMSSRYRAHLIQLVQGIANLGYRLATSPEPSLDGKQHQKALFDSDLQNMFIPC